MIFEKIEDANSYPCLSITLATLAKYYGRDYHMISGSDWKLQYDVSTSSKRIGEQIDIISEVNIKDRTMKFHGFTWEIEPFGISYINKDTGCFKNFGYPFLASIDMYYSRWSPFYLKSHFLHYVIISGYNINDKTYNCVDPYFQYVHYNVRNENLYSSMNGCGRIILSKFLANNYMEDFIQVIREDLMMVNINNANYINIKRLAKDILTKMDINYEFDEFKNNLQTVPILEKIRKIAMYRSSYSCMLDYVHNLFGPKYLQDASNLIKQSAILWNTIKGKLLKTYITGSLNSNIESISKMLETIAEIEKQSVELILFNG